MTDYRVVHVQKRSFRINVSLLRQSIRNTTSTDTYTDSSANTYVDGSGNIYTANTTIQVRTRTIKVKKRSFIVRGSVAHD